MKPAFETKPQGQVLGVTFVTENFINKVENWRVCDELNFSDLKTSKERSIYLPITNTFLYPILIFLIVKEKYITKFA